MPGKIILTPENMPSEISSSKETLILVNTAKDSVPGSLRSAINKANQLGGATIILQPSVGDSIVLKDGELEITSNIRLLNRTGHNLTISPKHATQRILSVSGEATLLELKSEKTTQLILSRGNVDDHGGAIKIDSTNHQLILIRVTIAHNTATGSGGGIYTAGRVIAIHSTIQENRAGCQGGGIWSGARVILNQSQVTQNHVTRPDPANGGGGIFVDSGDCLLNASSVRQNQVAHDDTNKTGGSGGGIVVMAGSIHVENGSHVDSNTAYNSAGIQEGIGNVYVIGNSTVNANESFNAGTGQAGGGGITIILGNIYISNSQVSDNKTRGMYSGGIVSFVGDVTVTQSQIQRNTNRGPGGGLAMNFGSINISQSLITHNTGASLGGGIVSFTPNPGFITISNHSQINHNNLTNDQTIQQTIDSFLDVINQYLTGVSQQATQSGPGGEAFNLALPDILQKQTQVSDQLKALPLDAMKNAIGGGGIACLLSTTLTVDASQINANYVGEETSTANVPFSSFGGGIFSVHSQLVIDHSSICDNTTLSQGGGIWSHGLLQVSQSKINHNTGGGLVTEPRSQTTLLQVEIIENMSKHSGGGISNQGDLEIIESTISQNHSQKHGDGIANNGKLTLIQSLITMNRSQLPGGGVFSKKPFINVASRIEENLPDNISP